MTIGRKNTYCRKEEIGLLFIEPISPPSETPLIDEATRKMTAALRTAKNPDYYMGKHECGCGVYDDAGSRKIGKFRTNSLCVHYLAYHRDEVPADELADVLQFKGEDEPTEKELCQPPKPDPKRLRVWEQKLCPRCKGYHTICLKCAISRLDCKCKAPAYSLCKMCNGSGWNPRYKGE